MRLQINEENIPADPILQTFMDRHFSFEPLSVEEVG
jgi:hypothetical protein